MAKLDDIQKYYSEKIREHGPVPAGVDWNSLDSQYVRFSQIAKVLEGEAGSVTDLGCGYGEFFNFLREKGFQGTYHGIDISDEMISVASARYGQKRGFRISKGDGSLPKSDYVVASGIFSVKLEHEPVVWYDYIKKTVSEMFNSSKKAIAFNCLTSYSDADKMKSYLYYAQPEQLFKFCKNNLSKQVALYHDYGLYEFTIVIRKELRGE